MKNITDIKIFFRILSIVLGTTILFSSCEEYLDVSPELGIDAEEVYRDYYSTRGVVDRANRLIQNYVYAQNDWACEVGRMSDESQESLANKPPYYVYNTGNWLNQDVSELSGIEFETIKKEFDNSDDPTEPVSKAFIAIRAVNNVLANLDLLTEYPSELGYSEQELKDQLLGQCYFLRGFHYFQVIRRYGGFPIMNQLFSPDHNFDAVRPTYLESTDALVADLDLAIKFLPEKWNDQNVGRSTKTTARALKAMVLLYASSPLMNPQLNPYGTSGKKYNLEYAKKTVEASIAAIDGYGAAGYEMFTFDDYMENWYSRASGFPKEAILISPLSRHTDPMGAGKAGCGWYFPQYAGGWATEGQPTHNAVSWFETADGYAVDDPEAISSGSLNPDDPYKNRDPRLYKLVSVHGDDMYEGFIQPTDQKFRVLNATPGGFHHDYEKNKGKFWCGYYHKGKLMWPGSDKWNAGKAQNYYRMFPHIRVPQLYLDFAEAANEVYGPNGAVPGTSLTAVKAINMVRARVGMPPVLDKYTTDKESFKKRIYNERAVEMYYEFHRWFDLRRWNLAKEVLGEGIYAADIREVNGKLVYGKKKLESAIRVFDDKHYWYPFPTSVMNMMTTFEQNPGW